MIYISIDLETTGLDPDTCQILEVGAVLEDTNNILPINELPTYHAFIRPEKGNISGNVFALHMNANIIEKLKNEKEYSDEYNYISIDELADDFLLWLHKQGLEIKSKEKIIDGVVKKENWCTINVAGKNFAGFDKKFLNLVPDFNKKIHIRQRVIDPAVLFVDWHNDETLPTLDQCKQKANIAGVVTHNAVDDALDVIKLLRTNYIG